MQDTANPTSCRIGELIRMLSSSNPAKQAALAPALHSSSMMAASAADAG